jgi:hypothetical protein
MTQDAAFSEIYSLGNCGEIAAHAFLYIAKHYPFVNVNFAYIRNGDHVFVIVHLPKGYNFDEKKSLGNAYICDPWSAWASIHELDEIPEAKDLSFFNRKYLWIKKEGSEERELYYCNEDILEIVPIRDKEKLKEDLNLLFDKERKALLHPTIINTLITKNGGHRPQGIVYPAKTYKKTLKNYVSLKMEYHTCADLKKYQIPEVLFNSDLFQDKHYKKRMLDIFLAKMESISKILEIYQLALIEIQKNTLSSGLSIFEGKINAIKDQAIALSEIIEKYNRESICDEDYFTLKEKLGNILKNELAKIHPLSKFSKNELKEVKESQLIEIQKAQILLRNNVMNLEDIFHSKSEMTNIFIAMINSIKDITNHFREELLEMKKNIHTNSHKKYDIIMNKILLVDTFNKNLSDIIQNPSELLKKNHFTLFVELRGKIKHQCALASQLANFSESELKPFYKTPIQIQINDAREALQKQFQDFLKQSANDFLSSGKVELSSPIELKENHFRKSGRG